MAARKTKRKTARTTKRTARKTTSRATTTKAIINKEPVTRMPSVPQKKRISESLAIVALILNIVILPGLGSLIGGKTKAGVWQLVLILVGITLSLILILIGIPLIIAAWVWGIVTGINLIQESHR